MERYMDLQSRDVFSRILQMDGLVQMNGGALLKFPGNIRCRRLIRKGVVHLLGSDCHNMENRKPNLHLAADSLTKHRLYSHFEKMAALSCQLFNNA
jgi:protein-tyrosine phosphatase